MKRFLTPICIAALMLMLGATAFTHIISAKTLVENSIFDDIKTHSGQVPTAFTDTTLTGEISANTTAKDLVFGSANKSGIENLSPQVSGVVINEVYGNGGNTGATFNRDFVELYNNSGAPVNISGYSLQIASSAATTSGNFVVCNLPTTGDTTIEPGTYYLIALGSTSLTVGTALPTADLTATCSSTTPTSTTGGGISGSSQKIFLVSNTTTLVTGTNGCPTVTTNIVDFVGYGTANCFEGATVAPAPPNAQSGIQRTPIGTDTDNNGADFKIVAPSPQNSTATLPDLTITQSGPTTAIINSPITYTLTVTNNGLATANGIAANFTLPTGGTVTYNNSTGTNGFTGLLNGTVVNFTGGTLTAGASATLTVTVTPTTSTTLTSAATNAVVDPNAAVTESNETNNNATTIVSTTFPGSIQFSAATYTVGEAGPTATITVTRTGGSSGAVSATYATSNGTATGGTACTTSGVDYITTTGTVSFATSVSTSQTFTIAICDDNSAEGDETVNLTLSAPTGNATLGTQNTAVLTITDNDVAANNAPTITANPTTQTVTSGGTGTSQITITDETPATVTLSGTSNNQTLVPNANITFSGTGASRTLSAQSVAGQTGTAVITVTATDAGSLTGTATYTLTVVAPDTTAPITTYTPLPAKANAGSSVLSVTATDDTGVTNVSITYAIGSGAPQTVACTSSGTTTYDCVIDDSTGNGLTVSYYVTATDAAGNSSRNPVAPNVNGYSIGLASIQAGTYTTLNINGGTLNGGNVVVTRSATFDDVIETAGNTIIIRCGATLAGGAANAYINGSIQKDFCTAGETFVYPVGVSLLRTLNQPNAIASAGYTPLTVTPTAVTGVASLTVTAIDGVLPGADTTNALTRYWNLTRDTAGSTLTADLTFNYNDSDVVGDETMYQVLKREGTTTSVVPNGTVNPAANTFSVTGVSAFSSWSAGVPTVATAAASNISGAVKTAKGRGIQNALVMVLGGGLQQPIYAKTSTFGNFTVKNLPSGGTYVISVISKGYTFSNPSQVISLTDDFNNLDFIANSK